MIFTMGFTQKSAEEFFEKIRKNSINLLIDVRLNNQSQLAGFTKGRDLEYFLRELADCRYEHDTDLAPTKELLKGYKDGSVSWDGYVEIFHNLMDERNITELFGLRYSEYENVLLLCSEKTPEKCHRRLLAEKLSEHFGYEVVHL